jgi:hypothetical protein
MRVTPTLLLKKIRSSQSLRLHGGAIGSPEGEAAKNSRERLRYTFASRPHHKTYP